MGISKQKYCKCGHLKETHKKSPKSLITGQCNKCACSSYLNRKKPFKSDYVFTLIIIGLAMAILILSFIVAVETAPLEENKNHVVSFTLAELHELAVLGLVLINVLTISWFVASPILEIFSWKKRKEFPIDDQNEQRPD